MVHMYQRLERTCTRYLLASRPARAVDRQFFVLSYSRGACLRARGVYSRFSRLARRRRVKEWPRGGGGKERAGERRTGILKLSTRRMRLTRIYRESL